MRSLQTLTALLATLSLAAGGAAPAVADTTGGRSDAAAFDRAATVKAGSSWNSPIAETDRFEYWFEICANAAPIDALEACERATEIEPDFAIAWDNLGAVLEQLGRYEDALVALDRALVLTPEDANIWYNVGVVLAKLTQYEASASAFEEAYRLNPEDEMARKYAELLRDQFGE